MDFVTETSVDSRQLLNVCQCCLANGCCKDISTEYYDCGQREVYEDMLKDTFDIQIPYHDNGHPESISRLICENCITRLLLPQGPLLKEEQIKDEEIIDDYTKDGGDDKALNDGNDGENDSDDDDEVLANLKQEPNWTKEENIDLPLSSLQKLSDKDTACTRKQVKTNDDTVYRSDSKKDEEAEQIPTKKKRRGLKKKFNCSNCSRSFSQKVELVAHMKQHSGVKDHICDICGAGFYSRKSLVRHNLIHKGERPFACHLCSKTFIASCDLNRHLRIHSGYKPFKCDTCAVAFNAKHHLQAHERMHTGERPYTCQVCNVAFIYKAYLNSHVAKVHGIDLKFKSIHSVTEDVLRREMGSVNETRLDVIQISPVTYHIFEN